MFLINLLGILMSFFYIKRTHYSGWFPFLFTIHNAKKCQPTLTMDIKKKIWTDFFLFLSIFPAYIMFTYADINNKKDSWVIIICIHLSNTSFEWAYMYSTEVKRKGSLRENLLLNRFSSLQEIPKMGGWEGKGTFKKHNEKEK